MLSAALPWRADTVYLRLGLVEQERGQIDAARAYWARTSLALPYLLAQGDARQVMGQTRVAKDYYAHAVALAPASSSARYRMGTVELARGDYVAALSSLQDALALDTYNDPSEKGKTYSALGSVMAAQGRWGDAVAFYEQAEAASPHFEDQGALAQALYRRDGNAQAAESYLRQSIAGKPGLVGPYVALMDILHSQGRDSEALDLGRQAMRRFPENTEPLLAAGRIYMAQDAYTEAENMFQRATVLRPRQAEARYWLGRAALAQQNLALAVQAFTEAVALAPGDSGYQTLLGNALHLTGDKAGAAAAYRRALEIDPNNATARRGLEGLTR
jgi:tetratricopeptide (TPR) repeat protein